MTMTRKIRRKLVHFLVNLAPLVRDMNRWLRGRVSALQFFYCWFDLQCWISRYTVFDENLMRSKKLSSVRRIFLVMEFNSQLYFINYSCRKQFIYTQNVLK